MYFFSRFLNGIKSRKASYMILKITLILSNAKFWISFHYETFCSNHSNCLTHSSWCINAFFSIIAHTRCEMCPNTEFFLVLIFPHLDWIRRDTSYLSVLRPNAGKYRPEKNPYLDTFHAVTQLISSWVHLFASFAHPSIIS